MTVKPLQPSLALVLLVLMAGCRHAEAQKVVAPAGFVLIPAGEYRFGTDEQERAAALSYSTPSAEAALRDRIRLERPPFTAYLQSFAIGEFPVSNREYAEFVRASGHRAPAVTRAEWAEMCVRSGLGLSTPDDFVRYVEPRLWVNGAPRPGTEDEPVTLVDRADVDAYCDWLGKRLGVPVRLPDELESQAAGGQTPYPWGIGFQDRWCQASPMASGPAPRGTVRLGTGEGGQSSGDVTPSGVKDYAGQVYEWTLSADGVRRGHSMVCGGGSWLDEPGDCRRCTRRSLPDATRHVLLGFRVVVGG